MIASDEYFERLKANIEIVNKDLAFHTFGNISTRYKKNYFIIKPSGVNLKVQNQINTQSLIFIQKKLVLY